MMKNSIKFFLLSATIILGACEMYSPGHLNETKIQIAQQEIAHDFLLSELTKDTLSALAQDYSNRGGSPMNLVVTYDPKSYRNTAMMAGDHAAEYAGKLRELGVTNLTAKIEPVENQGDQSHAVISYTAMSASAPDGCTDMPGMNSNLLEPDPAYRLGCGVDTMIAKQVAHPADLLGRGVSDPATDGRAAANVIEVYRTGAKNEPLEGQMASEE